MIAPGTRLGPYVIAAPIGAGGMGEVYKASDTRLDRTVAVKVLPEHVAADPELKRRFEREAKTLAALSHAHICPVFDVGSQDGLGFLVMEYLEGETLEQRLKKGALPLDQALQVGIQIADALSAAHRAGIIHRDLKPGNIMVTKAGAKLLDFGLAKAGAPAVAGNLSSLPTTPPGQTQPGTILGTFQYMAPEQLEGHESDARTDIFAFGVVLYEMMTGKKAFEGKSHASLIAAIMHADPKPVSSIQPLVPRALDRIVRKSLAKDPDERWQSARDLMDQLRWIAEPGEHPLASGTMPAVLTSARTGSVRLAWAIAGTSCLVAALAVAAGSYFGPSALPSLLTRLDVVTPPTTDAFSFAVSPDGRQLTFVANGEKGSQLWLRPLDQATAQPLPGTEGAAFPFWAPDNRAIGFFAEGKLKRINLAGGAPQVLADAPIARGGTWSRDGVIVFGQASPGALMRVAASGGAPSPLTELGAGQVNQRWPQFFADGRRILFFVQSADPGIRGVYFTSLDGGEPARVVESDTAAMYASPGYILRVVRGALVAQRFDADRLAITAGPIPIAENVGVDDGLLHSAFSVSEAGVIVHRAGSASRKQLSWIDRNGKLLGTIGGPDDGAPANPELSRDGRFVAMTRAGQGGDVWLVDVNHAVASRFTFDATIDRGGIWSPDGSRIVFMSLRRGAPDVFVKPANGSTVEQPLLTGPEGEMPLDWSPDGSLVLYAKQEEKAASDLWAIPLTGERKPVPVVQSRFDDVQGQLSPDGQWLAYASNEPGRYEVYVQAFPEAGGKWQVSTAGGIYPRWRRDGQELYYVDPNNRMMAVPIRPTADGRAVDVGAPSALFVTKPAVGANIFLTGYLSRAEYALAPDGRFLMIVPLDDATAPPITIVQNWTAALKQ
jgi:Tol biopolymer transport system component